MIPDLSAADPASPWMQHLERAHALAHVAGRAIEEEVEPSVHLAPAARQLERGIVAMYDAFDGRSDRVTAIGLANTRLWDAAILVARAGLPSALSALREACGELIAAEKRFPRVPLAGREPAPLRAGGDLPSLHTIERASLAPRLRAPPLPEPEPEPAAVSLPEPTTFEELAAVAAEVRKIGEERLKRLAEQAEAPEPRKTEAAPEARDIPAGFAFATPERLEEGDFVRRWARECFEEIGMLGLQRAPLLGDDWRACLALERRLVTAIDALAALGPTAIASIEPLALDAPTADPTRVFTMAMLGGCLEGRDVLAGAERVLHRFGAGDPPVAAALVSAMKLAPNPFAPNTLRSLLATSDRACRAIAVEVLGYRGWLTRSELAELAEDEDPCILALVLPALAAARSPSLGRALTRALAHPDSSVQEAALDAMALAAHPHAASAACVAATGALGDPALVRLAIVGDEDDARWLLERMETSPTPAVVEAVGWAGLVEAAPALLHLLEMEDEDLKRAVGAALERMLGAKLLDTIQIPPDALDDVHVPDPDPEPRPLRRTLAELVSDPRDQPPAGSSEELEVPSTDPERWRAYWAKHSRSYDPKYRIRRGQPYSPSISLYELDQLLLSPEDRRRLHRELAARTGKIAHFDPHDFVVVQERSLKVWESLVRTAAGASGSWGRPLR